VELQEDITKLIHEMKSCRIKGCSDNGFCDRQTEKCVCDMGFIGEYCSTPDPIPEVTARVARFEKIFLNKEWGNSESVSGSGSTKQWTESIRSSIANLTQRYAIKSVLDSPCGDFNWMKLVDYPAGLQYLGQDIVRPMITHLRKTYANNMYDFIFNDMAFRGPYKAFDLIICRDGLQHLSNTDAMKAIENFELSGSKYLLTTIYIKLWDNSDIQPGEMRAALLTKPPFNFEEPLEIFYDYPLKQDETKAPTGFGYKRMALWKLPIMRKKT